MQVRQCNFARRDSLLTNGAGCDPRAMALGLQQAQSTFEKSDPSMGNYGNCQFNEQSNDSALSRRTIGIHLVFELGRALCSMLGWQREVAWPVTRAPEFLSILCVARPDSHLVETHQAEFLDFVVTWIAKRQSRNTSLGVLFVSLPRASNPALADFTMWAVGLHSVSSVSSQLVSRDCDLAGRGRTLLSVARSRKVLRLFSWRTLRSSSILSIPLPARSKRVVKHHRKSRLAQQFSCWFAPCKSSTCLHIAVIASAHCDPAAVTMR